MMMKKLRDFKCADCFRVFEALVEDNTYLAPCDCGKQASRMLSAPRYLGNTTGKSPSRH